MLCPHPSYENHFKGADALRENLVSFRIKSEKFGPSSLSINGVSLNQA